MPTWWQLSAGGDGGEINGGVIASCCLVTVELVVDGDVDGLVTTKFAAGPGCLTATW